MKLVARHGGHQDEVTVEESPRGYRITLGGRVYDVDVAIAGHGAGTPASGAGRVTVQSLIIEGGQHELAVQALGRGTYRVESRVGREDIELMDPLTFLAEQAHGEGAGGPSKIKAYMPGVVKKVLVAEGDTVERGQVIAVLEAMKMENDIEAESDGSVAKIHVQEGQAVDGGEALFEIE